MGSGGERLEAENEWRIDKISPELAEECRNKITCCCRWPLKTEHKHYARVFLCEMETEEELKESWEDIVNRIAFCVQSGVESLLERSNFYVWFFVGGEVEKDLRKTIEDDTYSSKKYVVEGKRGLPEKEKLALVQKRLFSFWNKPEISAKQSVEKVVLRNFRAFLGEKTFDFTRNGKAARLVVIFAPNGMGKTSLFDGVEWGLTGAVDRFDTIKKKSVPDVEVLKNTDAGKMEDASVCIFFDNGNCLKRRVSPLNGNTRRDIGTGRVSYPADDELAGLLGEEFPWNNLILQHHKIDGFIAAAKPEQLYDEWGGLWDPDGRKRKLFEQSYQEKRKKEKEQNDADADLQKARKEYKRLDNSRGFAEKLTADAARFQELSGGKELKVPDFKTIAASEYVEWSNRVDLMLDQCEKRQEGIREKLRYVREELLNDVRLCNISAERGRQAAAEIAGLEKSLARCHRKKELLLIKTEGENQLSQVQKALEEHLFLRERGSAWFRQAKEYFLAAGALAELRASLADVKAGMDRLETEREQLKTAQEEKKAELLEEREYNRLRRHLEEIKLQKQEKERLKEQIAVLETEQEQLKSKIHDLKLWQAERENQYLYTIEEVGEAYHSGELEQKDSDEALEKKRKQISALFPDYLWQVQELSRFDRLILEEERVEAELGTILEESRELISKQRRTSCPVCNTDFSGTEALLKSTYRSSSEQGEKLKTQRKAAEQELKALQKLLERHMEEYNLRVAGLISEIEKKLQKKFNELKGKQRYTEEVKRHSAETEERIRIIQEKDQERDVYVVYTEAGIENFRKLWKSGQEKALSELILLEKEKEQAAAMYRVRLLSLKNSIRKKEEIIQSVESGPQEHFLQIKKNENLIRNSDYEELLACIPKLDQQREELLSEVEYYREELLEFQDLTEAMEQLYEKRRLILKEYLKDAGKEVQPALERINRMMQTEYTAEQILEGAFDEKAVREAEQNFSHEEFHTRELIEALRPLKYNHAVENYFAHWKAASERVDAAKKEADKRGVEAEAAREAYREEKQTIERDMQEFLQMFQVSDIYEKLEPHEELKTLVGEFRFNENEHPELSFCVTGRDGKTYSPAWYFSTAQLNVVAFSVFLGRALQAQDVPIKSIFIDDPVGHFDEMNVVEFVDLLRNILENTDRQLIISTHEERVFGLIKRKIPEEEYPVRYINLRTEFT